MITWWYLHLNILIISIGSNFISIFKWCLWDFLAQYSVDSSFLWLPRVYFCAISILVDSSVGSWANEFRGRECEAGQREWPASQKNARPKGPMENCDRRRILCFFALFIQWACFEKSFVSRIQFSFTFWFLDPDSLQALSITAWTSSTPRSPFLSPFVSFPFDVRVLF